MYDTAYTVALDIRREYCHTLLNARRGDAGRKLIITLTEGDDRYVPPAGTAAVLSARKPDGNLIYNSCTLREDGRLELKITPQMTAVPGLVECQIKLSWPDGSQLTGAGFALAVEDVVFDAGDIPGSASESTLIADILEKAGQAADLSGQAGQALADADAACQKALAAADRADAAADKAAAGTELVQQAQSRASEALETARRADEKADAARQILSSLHSAIQVTDLGTGTLPLGDSAEAPLHGLTLYGRTVGAADGSLTTAGDGETQVTVAVSGRNLLPYPYVDLTEGSQTVRGATVTVDSDGSIHVSGTFTSTGPSILGDLFLNPGSYVYSSVGKSGAGSMCNLQLLYLEGNSVGDAACDIVGAGTVSRSFTVTRTSRVRSRLICYKDATVDVTFRPMIRLSGTADDFVPYAGSQASAAVSNGLPGIAVASGGSHTDEAGQRWICDEVDFGRGCYIRRIGRIGTEEITSVYSGEAVDNGYAYYFALSDGNAAASLWAGRTRASTLGGLTADTYYDRMNTAGTRHLFYFLHTADDEAGALAALKAEKAQVFYSLVAPVETALSAAALNGFAQLRSRYPMTVVSNSAGASMAVGYTADTKTYVDNKFAQLSAALVNG